MQRRAAVHPDGVDAKAVGAKTLVGEAAFVEAMGAWDIQDAEWGSRDVDLGTEGRKQVLASDAATKREEIGQDLPSQGETLGTRREGQS